MHSDGTSKHVHSYTTFDVNTGEQMLVVGLWKVGGADAQSQLDFFEE